VLFIDVDLVAVPAVSAAAVTRGDGEAAGVAGIQRQLQLVLVSVLLRRVDCHGGAVVAQRLHDITQLLESLITMRICR